MTRSTDSRLIDPANARPARWPIVVAVLALLVASAAAPAAGASSVGVPPRHTGTDAVAGDANASAAATPEVADSTTVSPAISELVSAARAGDVESRFVSRSSDGVRVSVTVEAAPGRAGDATDLLERHGAVTSRFGGSIGASLPPEAVGALADARAIDAIRRPAPVVDAHQGSVVSEGLSNVNVSGELHESGITGSNVTVAVVDTGFNLRNDEIDHHVAGFEDFEGDGMDNESNLHGTAVAELVVDVAPNASLLLYEVDTATGMGAAIEHVTRNTSADVASMSLGLLAGPFDGTSAVDRAIDDSVANGTAWFVSAGNYADDEHYNQTWRDGDGDGWMDVSGSRDAVTIDADGPVTAYVSWADENASGEDYDVYLNQSGDVVDRSTNRQDGDGRPVEAVSSNSSGEFALRIKNHDSDGTADFDVFVDGRAALDPSTSARSVVRPATGDSAVAVGAVYHGDDGLEAFSSRGPTVDGRTKPELVGPNGVTTSQPSGSLDPFFGTSAATPHAAGIAALVVDGADGSIDPGGLRRSLTDGATPLAAGVPNDRTGYGLVNATGALAAAGVDATDGDAITASLGVTGGSVAPDTAEASTTVTHDIAVAFENVSADGATDRFDVAVPDAAGGSDLTIDGASATNPADGSDVPVESVRKVDGPDGDGIEDTARIAVSPTGGGMVDVEVTVSIELAWPSVESSATFPMSAAGKDSETGSVPLTDVASVTVRDPNEPPTADVSIAPTRPTVGETATLDASASSDPDGSIVSYEWRVGNETIGTGETISHGFDAVGEQEVRLTVTDGNRATDTATETVAVNAPPTPAMSITPSVPSVGEAVTFDVTGSGDADGSIARYEWTVDGRLVGTGETLPFTFDAPGDHRVHLTVIDDDGAVATASESVGVNAPPTATITTPPKPTAGETVTFDATGSADSDGSVVGYEWTVDDEVVGTGETLSYAFDSAGDHRVELTVADTEGETDAANTSVTVNAAPTAAFALDPVEPTVGEVAMIDAAQSTDDGTVTAYEWTVDGEVVGTNGTLPYTFESPGEYQIGLAITDDDGATDTATETVAVNAPPTASLSASITDPEVGETVPFRASDSVDPDGDVETYEWDLDGDGVYDDATGVQASATFASAGETTVGLRVADDDVATNVTTVTVSVLATPTASPAGAIEPSRSTSGSTVPSSEALGLPGFGPLVALLALLALAVLARSRT